MKKKILAFSLLTTLFLSFSVAPSFAILDKITNKKGNVQTQSVLDTVNYDWWKNQNDPYLEDYILRAIQNNHDIKTTQLKIEQAQINVQYTRSNQLPSLSIGAAPAIAKIPDSTKSMGTIALPVIASWELDLFGKNWDKTKSSKKILKGVEQEVASNQISIVSLVGSVYYNVVKLDKIINSQANIINDRKNIYDLMKVSNAEGIASTSDLIAAEKSYVLAQNDMIEYQKARQQALNALAVLIGDSPENIKEYKRISYDKLSKEFSIPNEISSEIIVNRPDYKSLEYQLQAAGLDIRVAKKEFLPTIDILGLMTFLATSTASTMNWNSSLSLLAGSATLPIFTGFKRVANLKLNKNKYQQLVEQYQKTNLVAIQEVNDALYNYKSDNEKMKNNIVAYNIQKKEFDFSKAKYQQGTISKLDLLQQEESLKFMEQLMISSKMDCYIDKISLYKATGAKI